VESKEEVMAELRALVAQEAAHWTAQAGHSRSSPGCSAHPSPGRGQAMSRGLSVSDTPGHGSQEFPHPEGVAGNAAGLASLQSGIPSGCANSLIHVPGVSSRLALLNPRLIAASPPGCSNVGCEPDEAPHPKPVNGYDTKDLQEAKALIEELRH
jgi:hypothetical protein